MKKLAIVITHPIQYYTPVFKLLAQQVNLLVFYTCGELFTSIPDPGFGKIIKWDIDLFDGYNYQWVNNTAAHPGSHHFNGIINPDLIHQIELWQPDTILIYGWAYNSHLKTMRYFKSKVPIFFRGDSTLLDKKSGLKNLMRWAYLKWIYKHIDYALYTGLNNKAYFKKYGISEDRLIFVPHAIDNNRFAVNRNIETENLKRQLKLNKNDLLILFAGKYETIKNPLLLLRVFISLPFSNIHLLFVGNGKLEHDLKQEANQHANVHFMDFQNQTYMPVIYQACDIYCLPSKSETWGLSVNEAMSCGKAILVSNKVGCAADLVKHGVNGYIHEAGSFNDLSEKLTNLINKGKKELLLTGENSKEIIKSWNIEVQANNIINYINGSNP